MLPIPEAQNRPLLLLVEGLIGSGKSTATLSIAEVMGLVPLLEPVNSNPYLDDFYECVQGGIETKAKQVVNDVISHSLPDLDSTSAMYTTDEIGAALEEKGITDSMVPAFMQLHLLTKRFSLYQAAVHGMPIAKMLGHPANGAILDRSLCGDTVFARMNAADGNIKPREFSSYFSHWQTMQNFLPYAHAMVFLRVTPKVAKRRCDNRGRPEEIRRTGGFPIEYMIKLDNAYQDLLEWSRRRLAVIDIDYNRDIKTVPLAQTFNYPCLVDMYKRRGVDPSHWPNVLPLDEAHRLVDQIKSHLPENSFWDRTAPMAID